MLASLIFGYIFRKTRKRSEDDVDGTDDTETKRSAINKVLLVWGIVESFSLILVLLRMFTLRKQRGFPENFMNGLCKSAQKCDTLVIRIILYKLLSSIALIIGAVYKLTIPRVPWLLINVLGIFPFSLVVTSAMIDYIDVKDGINNSKIISYFFK